MNPPIPKLSSCTEFPASSNWVSAPFLRADVFPDRVKVKALPFTPVPVYLAFLNWFGKRGPYLFFLHFQEIGFPKAHIRT